VLVDDDNVVNILSNKVMAQIRIPLSRLALVKTSLIKIEGLGMPIKGALEI
jgi:hypothetical protein